MACFIDFVLPLCSLQHRPVRRARDHTGVMYSGTMKSLAKMVNRFWLWYKWALKEPDTEEDEIDRQTFSF